MKKWISALMAIVICLSFAACGNKEPEKGPYTDGTYEVNAAEFSHGWKEYVIFTVTNGNISAIEFNGKNEAGDKKSEDAAYKDNMVNAGFETYPEKFYVDIVASMMKAGFNTDEMENVAGATTSTESFKILAGKAMEMIENGEPGVFNFSPYKDGEYTVEDAEFSHGWKDYVVVTVANGEITSVEYDAKNEAGDKKTADAAYKESMVAGNAAQGLPETYPGEFMPKLAENFMASGTVEGVEAVAGATSSTGKFKELMTKALENAKEGKTGVSVLSAFKEGEYRAEGVKDSHGWTEFVELTIYDGTVQMIIFDAVNEEGQFKSQDAAYKEAMASAGSDTYPAQFYGDIVDSFMNSGFVANDMENVAGATTSTESFKKLVVAALESAKTGSTETVVVE